MRRTRGLDTLRALAISLVFMYHYMAFVSREPTFGWVGVVGWVGVDLFFVLSGYLIGNQLFAGVARGEALSLAAFYARRGLRTWPAFWVVLAAYFLFPSFMGGNPPPPLWRFLTFTQNFGLVPGTAFSHAWSLCIEEQFYVVLPLVLVIALRAGSRRSQAWWLLGALLAVGIASRTILWSRYGRESFAHIDGYYPKIYYATLCRFDEFLPGIAIALLKNFHPQVWQRLMRHGQAVFVVGALATATMLYGILRWYDIDGYGYGFFMTAFGYSLLAMAFGLLVVAALSPACWLHATSIPGARPLALASYSIYLSHKAVCFVVAGYARQFGFSPTTRLAIAITLSLAVGALLYRVVEMPFMRIRERYFPTNFRPAQWPAAVAERVR